MGVKRFVLAAAFALLCAGWAQASTIEPGHFIVDLNNPDQTVGGWGAETLFIDTVNTIASTNGFTAGICIDTDASHPNGDDPDCDQVKRSNDIPDPRMVVNGGGGSIPFPSSFNANEQGGGIFNFQNDSNSPYTDILFTTVFNAGQIYTCASDIYSFCGFQVVHEMTGPDQLQILFKGGSIPVASPEPSQYLVLLIACAVAIVVHRRRSRRVSA